MATTPRRQMLDALSSAAGLLASNAAVLTQPFDRAAINNRLGLSWARGRWFLPRPDRCSNSRRLLSLIQTTNDRNERPPIPLASPATHSQPARQASRWRFLPLAPPPYDTQLRPRTRMQGRLTMRNVAAASFPRVFLPCVRVGRISSDNLSRGRSRPESGTTRAGSEDIEAAFPAAAAAARDRHNRSPGCKRRTATTISRWWRESC